MTTRSPAEIEVVEVEPDDPRFADVLRLAKSGKKWLGFLPDAGFSDRARQGTLLVATAGENTVGYILFDLPSDRVKLVHLCVAATHRRQGVAGHLVAAVSARHASRRGIELSCRRDFPAHELWPELGFRPVADRTGRSHAGLPLTVWQLSHGHPDLFTLSTPEREIASLDHNVFQDLVTARPQGRESRHLRDDWIDEYVEICITDEVAHEINQCKDAALRKEMLSQASSFRHLSAKPASWKPLVPIVEQIATSAGPGDHRHIARSVASGATYFVTRDDDVLKAASDLEDELRIVVVRPEGLIRRLDQLRSAGRYAPNTLQATAVVETSTVEQNEFVKAFLNHAAGERGKELLGILRPALATPDIDQVRVVSAEDERLLGGVVRALTPEQVEVKLIRVSKTDSLGDAVARQIAFLQRKAAADANIERVVISDPHPSAPIVQAFSQEGYSLEDGQWICRVERGFADASVALEALADDTRLVEDATSVERSRWPLKVIGGGIPVFMIAIEASWAEQLFATDLAEATLFGRELGLGLSREHVYYRKPGAAGGLTAPARIIWYVKGGSPGHPTSHVRAISGLAEVVVGRPQTLFQRFTRLGIYTQEQVHASKDAKGCVMALRFVDTELLHEPISLDDLRTIYDKAGLRFTAPQSPRRVPEHMFRLLYERGSSYAV